MLSNISKWMNLEVVSEFTDLVQRILYTAYLFTEWQVLLYELPGP